MNQVTLVGTVSREPKITTTPTGAQVCRFTLATEAKKKDGGKYDEFHAVETWSKSTIEFLKDGMEVVVVGKLKTDSWVDPQNPDGPKKYMTKVSAFQVFFSAESLAGKNAAPVQPIDTDEDIPF